MVTIIQIENAGHWWMGSAPRTITMMTSPSYHGELFYDHQLSNGAGSTLWNMWWSCLSLDGVLQSETPRTSTTRESKAKKKENTTSKARIKRVEKLFYLVCRGSDVWLLWRFTDWHFGLWCRFYSSGQIYRQYFFTLFALKRFCLQIVCTESYKASSASCANSL